MNVTENYLDLIRLERELRLKISEARKREIREVVAVIIRLMSEYGISISEIECAQGRAEKSSRRGRHIPKYIDPASGKTWSGRGRRPRWLDIENIEIYKISGKN
jgi:DNA-binding protein H-NS